VLALKSTQRSADQMLGDVGKRPNVFSELEISFFLLSRLLGVKSDPKTYYG